MARRNHMKKQNIKALILVAGDGGRLQPVTYTMPKCLLSVGGKPLLWYSISNLYTIGVSEIIFVVGHKASMIRRFVREFFPNLHSTFIYNNAYEEKNSIYSFFLARKHIRNTNFLRLAGDLLYNKEIPERLTRNAKGITSAVEPKKRENAEEFSIRVNKKTGTVIEYGKQIPWEASYGVAQGIDYVPKDASQEVVRSLEAIINNDLTQEFPEYAFQHIAQTGGKVYYQDNLKTDFWCDVDTKEDLTFANTHIHKIMSRK